MYVLILASSVKPTEDPCDRPKDEMAAWDRFFTEFQPESFPNLREMQVSCCVWPTSE
jgi:hypothetical protein